MALFMSSSFFFQFCVAWHDGSDIQYTVPNTLFLQHIPVEVNAPFTARDHHMMCLSPNSPPPMSIAAEAVMHVLVCCCSTVDSSLPSPAASVAAALWSCLHSTVRLQHTVICCGMSGSS
jgi:hypothetical protein